MTTSNVSINISAPQYTKRSKRRTFSNGYKQWVCSQHRELQIPVSQLAIEEELIESLIYTWLKNSNASTTEDPKTILEHQDVQQTIETPTLELIKELKEQIQQLSSDFNQFKQKLSNL